MLANSLDQCAHPILILTLRRSLSRFDVGLFLYICWCFLTVSCSGASIFYHQAIVVSKNPTRFGRVRDISRWKTARLGSSRLDTKPGRRTEGNNKESRAAPLLPGCDTRKPSCYLCAIQSQFTSHASLDVAALKHSNVWHISMFPLHTLKVLKWLRLDSTISSHRSKLHSWFMLPAPLPW